MDFVSFDYLMGAEKKRVRVVFSGWNRDYLETLKFKEAIDGWMARDEDLRATVYMHIGRNGGKKR